MEINTFIFIAAAIMTGVISFHLMFRFMVQIGKIEDDHHFTYPVYACVIALCATSYIVQKTSLIAFPSEVGYNWAAVGLIFIVVLYALVTVMVTKEHEQRS